MIVLFFIKSIGLLLWQLICCRNGTIDIHEFSALWKYIQEWKGCFDRYSNLSFKIDSFANWKHMKAVIAKLYHVYLKIYLYWCIQMLLETYNAKCEWQLHLISRMKMSFGNEVKVKILFDKPHLGPLYSSIYVSPEINTCTVGTGCSEIRLTHYERDAML